MPKPPINDEEPIKHDIQAELLPRKDAAVNTKELSSVSEKLNLSTDTVLLFIILLILSMGGGDRDDGAVFSILLLLMT